MANSSYRVNIPKNAEELLDLAAKVYQTHRPGCFIAS